MPKESEIDVYLKNMKLLVEHCNFLATGKTKPNNAATARDMRAILGGSLAPSEAMIARYQKPGVPVKGLIDEVQSSTHYAFSEYLRLKHPQRWGTNDQEALTNLYDWFMYGPSGAPPDAPHDIADCKTMGYS